MSTFRRQIVYDPLPSQLRFHLASARFRLFSGAVASGKSSALVQECIRLSYINKGRLGLIGAPTYRLLHDTTEREFFEVLETNKIPYTFHKSDREVILTEVDSHIIFRTLDDPTKLVGTNLAWWAIDEGAYISEGSFLRLLARLRDKQATFLSGIVATTPNGLNWVYDRFIGELKTADYVAIRAVPGENKHLAIGFYENLKRSYDDRFYRQEVLGEYLSLRAGTVYHAFDRVLNLDPTIQFSYAGQLCWSLDFNVDPMCSVIAQILDHAPNLYTSNTNTKTVEVLEEIVIRAGNIDLVCKTFTERIQKFRRPGQTIRVHVYGDASGGSRSHAGPSDYALIRKYFARESLIDLVFHVNEDGEAGANPAVKDRVNAVNAALRNFEGEAKLTIHPDCKTLISDLERVIWAVDGNGNTLDGFDKKQKMLNHIGDALGYLINSEFSVARASTGGWQSNRII